MGIKIDIDLICVTCGEVLDAVAVGSTTFEVAPCTSLECTTPMEAVTDCDLYPELEPLMMPYATLVRLLKGKEVTVTYVKKLGEIRELTGYLGELDSRSSGNLVYFHELIDHQQDPATQVKCLMIERIGTIEHFEDGVTTVYNVMEAL